MKKGKEHSKAAQLSPLPAARAGPERLAFLDALRARLMLAPAGEQSHAAISGETPTTAEADTTEWFEQLSADQRELLRGLERVRAACVDGKSFLLRS